MLVLAWGKRLAKVVRGPKGKRVSSFEPNTRYLLELVNGSDPPAGYQAWWKGSDIVPLVPGTQLPLL